MLYDYIILGAGITALTLLKKMRQKNITNILAIEKENMPGGLCRSFDVQGHVVDIGGHFFQTKYKDVEDFLFESFPKDKWYQIDPRITKINIENKDIDYPLESNLWQLPINKQVEYLLSVIRNGEALGMSEPKNYEEWIRWKLGDKICDNYLIPYNIKLWGASPAEMDIDWIYKIPRVEVEEVLKYSLSRQQDIEKFPCHNRPYYPKSGGYGGVIDAVAKDELHSILFNTSIEKLSFDEKKNEWLINDYFKTKNIITTIPWKDLYIALGEPQDIKQEMEKIQNTRLVISLFELENKSVNYHWRYRPQLDVQHHRELYISNFVKNSKQYGVFTETNLNRFNEKELSFEGKNIFNYTTDAAYPIPLLGKSKAIQTILEKYKSKNLFGLGRWGEHQHHNHDICIKHAIDFVANL